MLRTISVILLLSFAVATGLAQSSAFSDKAGSVYDELAKAPGKAVARRNPLDHDPDAVAAGAKLFEMHCAECHGASGEGGTGSKKGPSLRVNDVQQATPGSLFWLLTNGVVRRGMPVWSKLPEPQRWQLVSYIKSLGLPPRAETEGNRRP